MSMRGERKVKREFLLMTLLITLEDNRKNTIMTE